MCFVWISEQTAIISLYDINWLVFYNRGRVCLLRGMDWVSTDFGTWSHQCSLFNFTTIIIIIIIIIITIIIIIISDCLRLCLVQSSSQKTGFEPSVCLEVALQNIEMSV